MIDDDDDAAALHDISARIGLGRMLPGTAADISSAARRVAAVIGDYPLGFRNAVEAAKTSAVAFHATDRCRHVRRGGQGRGRSLFDAIWRALEESVPRSQ